MTHLMTKQDTKLRQFTRKCVLALLLLLGSAGVRATDYVLTWTSNNVMYFVGMNGNSIAVKTSFDPTCIWTCYNGTTETNLGTNSRSLRNKNNTSYYLTTSRSGNTWAAPSVQTSASSIWRSSSGTNGNVYARIGTGTNNASLQIQNGAWAMYPGNTTGSQNYKVTTEDPPHALSDNTTLPTISIESASGNTISFSRTNLTGTYTPGYTLYTFNGTSHYWYDNADHSSVSAITPNPTYRWGIVSGDSYADINSSTGVLTLHENVAGNIKVRLYVENLGSLGTKTVDFDLTATPHDEVISVVSSEITTPTIDPTTKTLNYGETQTFTASATATVTSSTTPAYTVLTGGGNTYYYYNNTLNNAAPTASAPVETHPEITYTWSLTGDAATGGYLTPTSGSGPTHTVRYNKISTSQVTGTLTVTASVDLPGVAAKTATASITATKTSVTDILVYPETIIVGVGGNRQFTYTLQPLGIEGTVTVTSGSTSIATTSVSDNTVTVTGVAAGTTNITVSVDGLSKTVRVTVVEDCATPTITITPASGGNTATVALSTTPADATIYYTTDGSTPTTSSTVYTGTFSINRGQTVSAIAVKTDYRDSDVARETFDPCITDEPEITFVNGGSTNKTTVTITANAGETIYYTLPSQVKIVYGLNSEANWPYVVPGATYYGSWDSSSSPNTWTSNAASGLAGLTLTKSDGTIDRYSNKHSRYHLAYHPAAANTSSTLTLTAPNGYVITGFSAETGVYQASTYTLTAANGTTVTPQSFDDSNATYTPFIVTGLSTTSTDITITTTDASKWLTFTNFTVNIIQDPTTSSYDGTGTSPVTITDVPYGTTIKAIAKSSTCLESGVVSKEILFSYTADGNVVLDDREDHRWSYYQPSSNLPTGYPDELHSPDPRNVKITYKGNGQYTNGTAVSGVKVGIDADANTFVYYKTLEKGTDGKYAYTTIPNPFSVRPKNGNTYYGFSHWKVTSISGGTIDGNPTTINAETEIKFNVTRAYTTNCQSIEVVLEAVWDEAEVSTNGTFTKGYNSVERNFYVVSSAYNTSIPKANDGTYYIPCTYSSFYPNGTTDGTTAATLNGRVYRSGTFSASADSKIEYIILYNNSSTLNANGKNFTIGRGVTGYNNGVCANNLYGLNANQSTSFRFRIESGSYNNLYFMGSETALSAGIMTATMGCDYDRASGSNDKLSINTDITVAYSATLGSSNNKGAEIFNCTVKSGDYDLGTSNYAGSNQFYLSNWGSNNYIYGKRKLTVEGGVFSDIAGGMDDDGTENVTVVEMRIKGGTMNSVVYGGAQRSEAQGHRIMVITGGLFKGWIAGGANGNSRENNSTGEMTGNTYIYVGGNANVNSGNNTVLNRAVGGNVFGAGCGYGSGYSSGLVTGNTNVVIADKAYIERGVYGGGSYGYTTQTSNIYILGGTVDGKPGGVNETTYQASITGGVFGGACQNQGGTVNITMKDGQVNGGIYGGSNATGTCSGPVTMQIDGGQVGADAEHTANIHGGGFGQPTVITGNVDITLGAANQSTPGVVVWGDVYGGSALGSVNGTSRDDSKHTNVTLNKGDVHGNVYGGALGDLASLGTGHTNVAAHVYGTVAVEVNGGSVTKLDKSAGVFGCNNVNGAPQSTVTVTVNGTDAAGVDNVFGGGNHADYTPPSVNYPTVDIKGGTVNNSVYGGGNEADIKGNANVTMTGGTVKNRVFGGGNLGNVGTFTTTTSVTGHASHSGCIGKPNTWSSGGTCNVTISGGTVGDLGRMTMPEDFGYVFGASRGETADPTVNLDIDFTAYVKNTVVTISGDAFIIGSVYGGSENGHVRENTEVYIQGGQIGCGEGKTAPYSASEWTAAINAVTTGSISAITTAAAAMPVCSHWPYEDPYLPYDLYDATPGGAKTGTDGHTFYGNVFGGGSGYWPYEKQGGGRDWLEKGGWVEGNTYVEISGGHILTSIYGGNELTDVGGNCHVKMTGGTLGVPRTVAQMAAHPVTCYLFGAGKGDQRLYFTQRTNVDGNTTVEVEGGTIFGSVFGGGEDGHVKGNATITIGKDDHTGPHIGTTGTSYVDGNIFGAGRGFAGDALTSGVVQGNVTIAIKGGTMLGSIYGGGRLGSVGTYIVGYADDNYGRLLGSTGDTSHGNITINISGGTIGNSFEYKVPDGDWSQTWKDNNFIPNTEFGSADSDKNRLMHTKGGNVFGGCMGRLYKLDNSHVIHDWPDMGKARKTDITISGGTIKSNVYGGGEMGVVAEGTKINITGGIIGTEVGDAYTFGSVYGGGYGSGDNTNGYSVDETGSTLNARDYAGLVKGNTDIDISSSGSTHIWASVYGGGELASVTGSTDVNITGGEIGKNALKDNGYVKYGGYRMGNVFGGGKGSLEYPSAGAIKGNATVSISGGNVYHNVYGGGALGSVGTFSYEPGSSSTVCAPNTGTTTVSITGSAVIGINGWDNGMVNGASRGGEGRAFNLTHTLNQVAWVNESFVNIGTDGQGTNFTSPHITGSVYGGGENGHNYGNTTINVYSGHIGTDTGDHEHGNIYGAGCGTDTYKYDVNGNGTYEDDEKSFSNPLAGIIHGNSFVNIKGGKIERDVYGAGSMGTTEGNSTVTVTGGRINRNVFGGPKGKENARTEVEGTIIADIGGNALVDINYASTPASDDGSTTQLIAGSVFGGGEAGPVKGNVTVNMTKGLVLQDLYGGGALANTNISNVSAGYGTNSETISSTATNTTKVNLTGGTINGTVYGGGLGRKNGFFGETSDLEAKVYGNVTVELNKTQATDKCWIKGKIFGCNNLNGTPKGHALVHIYKTVTKDASDEVAEKPDKDTDTYELSAVYGGGNMAAYEPASNSDKAEVIIEGCDYTSIETVYGGGNAASAPATEVTVNSCYEIGTIFGGGNGKDALENGTSTPTENPGAHVGYKADGTTTYGTGEAKVNALGGMIHKVFGASNTKGNVRVSSVAFLDQADDLCPLMLDEVYGGGNEAFMDGSSSVKLGCIDYLQELYGGANAAPVGGDVELTVTSGRFERVFGGNNQSGTISGSITVNIEETGCHPIVIGELYGCGNQAPYETGSATKHPTINIKSFTSIGNVYGGGLGETAIVKGDPTVNVNEVMGDNSNSGVAAGGYIADDYFDANGNFKGWSLSLDGNTVTVPTHAKGKMGAIGTIFGGGNAAEVQGSTTVNIGTLSTVDYVSKAKGESEPRTNITVLGVDIRGNVFGGGNAANVTGNTNVTVGKEKVTTP